MKPVLVIFTFLFVTGSVPFAGAGESLTSDAQTKRVVSDPVLWGMIRPLKKKNKVHCKANLSSEAENKNPRWTCLNNQACSYTLTIQCYAKQDAKKEVMSIDVSGFDDNKENRIEDLTVTYLSK